MDLYLFWEGIWVFLYFVGNVDNVVLFFVGKIEICFFGVLEVVLIVDLGVSCVYERCWVGG